MANRMDELQQRRLISLHAFALLISVCGVIGCSDDSSNKPDPSNTCSARFLSYNGRCGDEASAVSYLETVSSDTFEKWQTLRHIRGADQPLTLRYLNDGDLALGRGMHMTEYNGILSAYVFNFGAAGQTIHNGFDALLNGSSELAVAMDDDPQTRSPGYEVQFHIYRDGVPVTSLEFDAEGPKFSPFACTACHGGQYEPATGLVRGAAFLPLLKEALLFPFALEPLNEDVLREMNALVRTVSPTNGIRMLVDAAYPSGVDNFGATYQKNSVPPSWQSESTLYLDLVRPYCVSCHSAHATRPFDSPADIFPADFQFACGDGTAPMPQAQEMRRQLNEDQTAKKRLGCH